MTAAAPDFDAGTDAALVALGARPVDVPMARTGINPLAELAYRKCLIALRGIYRAVDAEGAEEALTAFEASD